MDWWIAVAPAASILGAGLAYIGARAGARQRERTDRRAEWRQRFEIALDQLTEGSDRRRREIGREILWSLTRSEFATDEDRVLAGAVLARDLKWVSVAGVGLFDVTDMDVGLGSSDNSRDDDELGGLG